MTVEELQAALAEEQTVAEVAEAHGVALEEVVDALMVPLVERIQQAVDEGRITQEQADEQIAQMKEHVLQMLESCTGMEHGGFRGRPGGMRGGGFRGDGATAPGFPARMVPSADL